MNDKKVVIGSKGQRWGVKGVTVKITDPATKTSKTFTVHGWPAKEVYELTRLLFSNLAAKNARSKP